MELPAKSSLKMNRHWLFKVSNMMTQVHQKPFFMAGKSGKPQQNGIPLPYQYQGKAQMTIQRLYLEAFFNGTVELTLDLDLDWDYDRDGPDGRINASELQWLSVWGNTTNVDFGHVMF